jgi:hypothetical protein
MAHIRLIHNVYLSCNPKLAMEVAIRSLTILSWNQSRLLPLATLELAIDEFAARLNCRWADPLALHLPLLFPPISVQPRPLFLSILCANPICCPV